MGMPGRDRNALYPLTVRLGRAFKESWIKGPNAIWTVSLMPLSSLYNLDALRLAFPHHRGHGHWCTPDLLAFGRRGKRAYPGRGFDCSVYIMPVSDQNATIHKTSHDYDWEIVSNWKRGGGGGILGTRNQQLL